jgi:hypothetical protein
MEDRMLGKVLRYFGRFVTAPGKAAEEVAADPHAAWVGLWLALAFLGTYSVTVLIYYLLGHVPVTQGFLTVPRERWYLVQAMTTIPVGMAGFLSQAALAYLLCKAAGGTGSFDATFATQSYAMIIPCVVFMLSFELLVAPFLIAAGASSLPWPGWVEMLRVFVLPFAWIFLVASVTLARIHHLPWPACLGIAVLSILPTAVVMAVFIR